MRLIDVDEAIINFEFEWDDIPPTREEFVHFLKKQSIIDAVAVVRCRDCKYSYCNKYCTNEQWKDDGCATVTIEADDFCSYGERKEGAV